MRLRVFANLTLALSALLLTGVAAFMSACGSSSSSPTSPGVSGTPTNTPTTTCSVPNGGNVSTLAGSGLSGSTNATGTAASFSFPYGVAVDSSGNIYVADAYNNLIRKITSGGAVTTFAGSGSVGATNATGTAASFHNPEGVAVDSSGNIYVADTANHLIRKITPARVVSTFAGTGSPGSNNGAATVATFNNPSGVAVDSSGNVYVADSSNHLIRKITSGGTVSTLAGSGSPGSTNATGVAASFNFPEGVAVDSSGNVYVGDYNNHMIRKITPGGAVTTFAGSTTPGSTNATGSSASFYNPFGLVVDNCGNVYVADSSNHMIRKITSAGVVTTLAGTGAIGSTNGAGTFATFQYPDGVAVTPAGVVYVADTTNQLIRKIQ